MIREWLTLADFKRVVYAWAEELKFEQACSDKVIRQIFSEFDIDGDGGVSEADPVVKIERLIFGSPIALDEFKYEANARIASCASEPEIIDS